jgi:16S rRNA (cytosine967-C5)-methyltransferase
MSDSEHDPASPAMRDDESLNTRAVALDCLIAILQKHHTLDTALTGNEDFARLGMRDRAFVRMLVTTALRRLGQVDDLIARAMDKPGRPTPPVLEMILRLGVVQLVFMDVPAHAAVNTGVELATARKLGARKGFINALLRRIAQEGKDWTTRQDIPRLNTPDWLLTRWRDTYSLSTALEIAQANCAQAPLDITVKNGSEREMWANALGASILDTGTLRLNRQIGDVTQLPGYGDGSWWVQDAAASIPARLFGVFEGANVIDLCAAPGGKTAQLAASGASVTAIDRSAKRSRQLQDNLARLGLEQPVTCEAADAGVWRPEKQADYVLLDAPCTATGTLRRHPEIAWLRGQGDVDKLAATQARLLDNALAMLAPGGMLVYATCSLQPEEGEAQIERALEISSDIARKPITPDELGGLDAAITQAGDARILPCHLSARGGMDGFFISRVVKA